MKLSTQLDERIAENVMNEHELALRRAMHGRNYQLQIPIHRANMSMYNIETKQVEVTQTIIPSLNIYMDEGAVVNDKLDITAIEYRISYNHATFPLGHVYGASGHLCLGSIFVPSLISPHNPMQPLETLFLANDRVKHGDPKINITPAKRKLIQDELINTFYLDDKLVGEIVDPDVDWIGTDMLWNIGRIALAKNLPDEAYRKMEIIFKIIFDEDVVK